MIVDPLIALASAIEHVRSGEVGEIEMQWSREEGAVEESLTITARREIRPDVEAPPREMD